MLHSLLAREEHRGARVHVLRGPEFPVRTSRKLAQMVEANGGIPEWHEVPDEWCEGIPTEGFTGKATWYRIFVPEILADADRALFLDADTIVCDSLLPLWELEIAGDYVAAVTNVFPPWFQGRPEALGLPGPRDYFNPGVLLMNLDLMRREGCSEALQSYARANAAELEWRDQDALNAVLAGKRHWLEPRWNCMNSVLLFHAAVEIFGAEAVEEARRNPAVRHFEGPAENKPWHYRCGREMRELYIEHRRHTPWPRVRLEGSPRDRLLGPIEARARGLARRLFGD
jgi:lipopolysaccharide biosynthesis glycosyltransferase